MTMYAGALAEKAARKRALHSTAEISVGDPAAEGEDSDSGLEEMPSGDLLPALRRKSIAKKAAKEAQASQQQSQAIEEVYSSTSSSE